MNCINNTQWASENNPENDDKGVCLDLTKEKAEVSTNELTA